MYCCNGCHTDHHQDDNNEQQPIILCNPGNHQLEASPSDRPFNNAGVWIYFCFRCMMSSSASSLNLPPPYVSDEKKPPGKYTTDDKPTVRVYCKAKTDYSLTNRDGQVVLAPSNPFDPHQHWVKEEKFGKDVKDEEGFSAFALVNKATGLALKQSIGVSYAVQLKEYNPINKLDKSLLWTMGRNVGDGYRAVRAVDNIGLNLDGYHSIKDNGRVKDGTKIILWQWNQGDHQQWTIAHYCKFFNQKTCIQTTILV
uniref:ricin B-like lectin R40G3 n=1 Tax=Erigeron canadensis TaxID=72917 RepID=UPI001CB89848|nr:ricin B-like lectin R40G3 [Erigeron canadensis]